MSIFRSFLHIDSLLIRAREGLPAYTRCGLITDIYPAVVPVSTVFHVPLVLVPGKCYGPLIFSEVDKVLNRAQSLVIVFARVTQTKNVVRVMLLSLGDIR